MHKGSDSAGRASGTISERQGVVRRTPRRRSLRYFATRRQLNALKRTRKLEKNSHASKHTGAVDGTDTPCHRDRRITIARTNLRERYKGPLEARAKRS